MSERRSPLKDCASSSNPEPPGTVRKMPPECDWNSYRPSAASAPSKVTDPDTVSTSTRRDSTPCERHRAAEGLHLQPRRPDPLDIDAPADGLGGQDIFAAHAGDLQIAGERLDPHQPRQRSEPPIAADGFHVRLAVHPFDGHVAVERLDGDPGIPRYGHQVVHRHERFPHAAAEQAGQRLQKGTPAPRVVGFDDDPVATLLDVDLDAVQRVGGGAAAAGDPLCGPNRQVVAVHPGHGDFAADVGEREPPSGFHRDDANQLLGLGRRYAGHTDQHDGDEGDLHVLSSHVVFPPTPRRARPRRDRS